MNDNMNRKEANFEILRLLANEFNMHPDLRFGQVLQNLAVVATTYNEETGTVAWENGFYEEPQNIIARMISYR